MKVKGSNPFLPLIFFMKPKKCRIPYCKSKVYNKFFICSKCKTLVPEELIKEYKIILKMKDSRDKILSIIRIEEEIYRNVLTKSYKNNL